MAAKSVFLAALCLSSASASSNVTGPRQLGEVDVVEEVCSRIGRGFCETSLNMPTGVTMSYKDACTTNVCASRQHCGETCVKVPDTLRIDWEDVSPCDHFGVGSLVRTAEKTCSCLGKLKGFLEQASEFDSEPSAKALTAASEMFACLVKNGFHVQTNKPAVVQQLTAGDDYIIQAAPVDLELYTSMAVAISACVGGGACHLIHGVMLDYFKSAAQDVGAGFKDFVETFVLTGLLQPLVTASEVPQMLANDLPQALHCKANATEEAFKQLQMKIEGVKDFFQNLKLKVENIQKQSQKTLDALDGVLEALDSSVTAVIEHLQEGKVPLLDAVKQISDLREVKDLFDSLESLKAEAAGVKDRAEELDGLKMDLKDLGTADNCGLNDLLDNLKEIPSLKDWVAAPARMIEALDINANSVQAGIVSYNQWADLNVELPCSKMERWESSLLGQTVSADIPKFYSCDFSYKLPLPNEHIPYLRIKDAAKALAAA
ncbi:unnamed protein product [Symbiodinium pilosum]|uniref:Uncharacterized protein n=1 Tax=Symbiodinium pilosum TaxID=2952 RepID=A0A812JE55_SYMPI|nr:unnamed protein product [Symbiodinium pilosum]